MKKLTTKSIDALPRAAGKRYEIRDASCSGLIIRVSNTGAKVWYLSVRHLEKRRKIKIGDYLWIGMQD